MMNSQLIQYALQLQCAYLKTYKDPSIDTIKGIPLHTDSNGDYILGEDLVSSFNTAYKQTLSAGDLPVLLESLTKGKDALITISGPRVYFL